MKIAQLQITECPRDAMQGWKTFIPTETKIASINKLLEVGFDTIDFGSFVSAKAIPQLADTAEVLNRLTLDKSKSK
jgi:hydroxymethylglutaryl-CoA lyase